MAPAVRPNRPTDDEIFAAGEDLAAAFDHAAEWAMRIHERLDWLRAQRASGASFGSLVRDAGEKPMLLEATNSTLEALLTAGTRLRRLTAQALYADGLTMEQIAAALGVTRQRVSKLLNADPDAAGPLWTRH